MNLYYNTNGFAHHRLDDVVDILAEIGYGGIALTPDVSHLDATRAEALEIEAFRQRCESAGLSITIETGARFVLDPRAKHEPNLMSSVGFERRVEYYRRHIDLAASLRAGAVSLWSGSAPNAATSRTELANRLESVLAHGASRGVKVALEPEPGMYVETIAQYRELVSALGASTSLELTIDVGHLVVNESSPIERHLVENADRLAVVHLDDATRGIHEHRMIGEGEVPWREIARALRAIDFKGPLIVELSRHSHDAARAARTAYERLREYGF